MIAEIITVGTEILMGQILNSNAQYLALKMSELGVNLYHQSTVGDNMLRLTEAIHQALSRSDFLVLSGGLGPTEDDMTKWAVADVLGVELKEDAKSKAELESYFSNMGRTISPNNYRQILFPEGASILPNPNGTAPGCICETNGKAIAILPGPPHELKPMMEQYVAPYLQKRSHRRMKSQILRIFGIGESTLEYELRDLIHGQSNPTIAPYAKIGEVSLRITASGEENEDPQTLIDPVVNEICHRLGNSVYSLNDESLPDVVFKLLREQNKTIALAESISGGLVASELVAQPGISHYLLEGIVCYSNDAKIRMGVSAQSIEQYTAVSEEVAREMAGTIRTRAGADFGAAVTGVAGPGPDENGHPAGLMYVAVAGEKGVQSVKLQFTGTRARLRMVAALAVLDELRKFLQAE